MFLYGDSILGKLVAISIIVYLTYENVIHGLFACISLIWFYQSDFLVKQKELFTNLPTIEQYSHKNIDNSHNIPIKPDLETKADLIHYEKYADAYPLQKILLKTESDTIFRNQNCDHKLELLYNNSKIIHPEMIPHIFPEVSFLDNIPCNPCDKKCNFSVSKIENETLLMPKDSKADIIEWAKSWLPNKNDPYQGIGYVASYFR